MPRRGVEREVVLSESLIEDLECVLDALEGSLDWGSGFLSQDEIDAWNRLAKLINYGEENK